MSIDLFKDAWFIIPARKGSKGLPGKNRILLKYTLDIIPEVYYKKVIVSTDDNEIINTIKKNYKDILIHERSTASASDTASTKTCLSEVIKYFALEEKNIIMLYLTYPERNWQDINKAYNFFKFKSSKSLLCKLEISDHNHPYLYMFETENYKGKQVVSHNLYRRQDYPKCFKISHMIAIFQSKYIKNLNSNLYNESTDFYNIEEIVDVDTLEDLNRVINEKN
tara:strand:- start:1234 stop:1902 length:669 start_codon:yes stop_codon:yes gene_type:complete